MNKDSLFVYEEDGFCELKYSFKDLKRLERKNQKLHNNWNELKKWLTQLQKFKGINQQGFSWGVAQEVLDKMQELERGEE